MLHKLSKKITNHYIKKNKIDPEESEVYDYCFEILLSTLLNFIAVVIVCVATRMYLQGLLFTIGFMTMRNYAGGFHANTHFFCFFSLMLILAGMILCVYFIPSSVLFYMSIGFAVLSLLLTILLAPVDSANKPLDDDERKSGRIKSIVSIILLSLVFAVLAIFKVTRTIAFALSYATCAVSCMLVIGTIKNKLQSHFARKNPQIIN